MRWRRVMPKRHLDPARWLCSSPRPEDLRGIAGVLGIRYRALSDGEFNHTTSRTPGRERTRAGPN